MVLFILLVVDHDDRQLGHGQELFLTLFRLPFEAEGGVTGVDVHGLELLG